VKVESDVGVSSLEIAHDFRLPPPLDPHVASVAIRTVSNNPSDYFDLRLSASFGKEVVLLDSGGDLIEVSLCIKKAEIKFNVVNAELHLFELLERDSESWIGKEESLNSRLKGRSAEAGSHIGIDLNSSGDNSASVRAAASMKVHASEAAQTIMTRPVLPWRLLSDDTVQLGYLDDFDRELSGRIVDENISVRVKPTDSAKKVGVLARVRVREQWIEIADVSIRKGSSKLKKYWAGLNTKSKAGEERRRLFNRLLAHLIAVALQEVGDQKNATIAAAAIVMVPTHDVTSGIVSPKPRQAISVDPQAVENFLSSDLGDEMRVLRENGVIIESEINSELSESILDFLKNQLPFRIRSYVFAPYDVTRVVDLLSQSLGLEVEISTSQRRTSARSESREDINVAVNIRFGPLLNDAKRTRDLLAPIENVYLFASELLETGAAIKGDTAYQFAKILGFKLSYQSFQKRVSQYGVRTGYGYILTYRDIAAAIGYSDAFSGLVDRQISLHRKHSIGQLEIAI
jgi:hypothetical protein